MLSIRKLMNAVKDVDLEAMPSSIFVNDDDDDDDDEKSRFFHTPLLTTWKNGCEYFRRLFFTAEPNTLPTKWCK